MPPAAPVQPSRNNLACSESVSTRHRAFASFVDARPTCQTSIFAFLDEEFAGRALPHPSSRQNSRGSPCTDPVSADAALYGQAAGRQESAQAQSIPTSALAPPIARHKAVRNRHLLQIDIRASGIAPQYNPEDLQPRRSVRHGRLRFSIEPPVRSYARIQPFGKFVAPMTITWPRANDKPSIRPEQLRRHNNAFRSTSRSFRALERPRNLSMKESRRVCEPPLFEAPHAAWPRSLHKTWRMISGPFR